MDPPKETRGQRVSRLKNKFRHLGSHGLLREYVRYERAKAGQLAHPYPPEYVAEVMDALQQLILERFDNDGQRIGRFLKIVRKKDSEPF